MTLCPFLWGSVRPWFCFPSWFICEIRSSCRQASTLAVLDFAFCVGGCFPKKVGEGPGELGDCFTHIRVLAEFFHWLRPLVGLASLWARLPWVQESMFPSLLHAFLYLNLCLFELIQHPQHVISKSLSERL